MVGNEIMEVLRENRIDGETYHEQMLWLIESPEADGVMRDYAIQHLTQWDEGEGMSDAVLARKDEAFLRILDVIELPENAREDFTGTALTSLRIGLEMGEFGKRGEIEARLGEVVMKLASGEVETSTINRLTAIQVASELELSEAAAVSREILSENGGVETDVKLSAIASLGLVGESQDLAMLERFENEDVLSFAARAAMKRIEARVPQTAGSE